MPKKDGKTRRRAKGYSVENPSTPEMTRIKVKSGGPRQYRAMVTPHGPVKELWAKSRIEAAAKLVGAKTYSTKRSGKASARVDVDGVEFSVNTVDNIEGERHVHIWGDG